MPAPSYHVLFDGTPHCPWGRQMFVREEIRREPPPLASQALFYAPLAQQVYARLQAGDYTLAGLVEVLNAPPHDIYKCVARMVRRDLVTLVDEIVVRDPKPGQHARAWVYGVRK